MCIHIIVFIVIVIAILLIIIRIITNIIIIIMIMFVKMGGAPRNLAPRSRVWVWIVKPSGCHCTDGHLTSRVVTED